MSGPPSTPTGSAALIVLDGLGDRPNPETGGVSPVEAAATPNLDRLQALGTVGTAMIIGPGVAPESDAGVLALLGYDPATESPGRGVLEALGVELPLASGDVALRMNFATIDGDGVIVDSRVGRSLTTTEAQRLAAELTRADLLSSESIRAEFRSTVGHRGVLWLHPTDGRPLSPEVSNADPFYERLHGLGQARRPERPMLRTVQPLDASPEAERTARALNGLLRSVPPILAGQSLNARRALAGKLIANAVLVRNAGAIPARPPEPFARRHGRAGTAITEMPVERGIARLLGLRDRFVGPMGPDRDRSLSERAQATRAALQESPFVYVHLKGPDEPGHDGRAQAKRDVVEALDRSFFGPFLDGLDLSTVRVAVTADHATPCVLRGHSDDPVPLLLAGAGVTADPRARGKFGEGSARAGPLGARRASEVIALLFAPSIRPQA